MNPGDLAVDLVYLWVDGNDPQWLKKKNEITGDTVDYSEVNCVGRYSDNEELRYSLRSVQKNIPWIRNIFIVTDNQVPIWLDQSQPNVKIIDHKIIMPERALPTFNAAVIEFFLYKIPGLSEHFLYANDDMFVQKPLSKSYFFNSNGQSIVRLKRKYFGKWRVRVKRAIGKNLGQYAKMILDSSLLVEKLTGRYYSSVPHHNIDAYIKSEYKYVTEELFKEKIDSFLGHKIRSYGEISRAAISYYALAVGDAELRYVGRKESSRILVHKHDFVKYIQRYDPELFCLNDNQRVKDEHRLKIRPFLEQLFPKKSRFEK